MPPPQSNAWSYFKRDVEWETLETKLDDIYRYIPLYPFKKQNVSDEEIVPKKTKVQRSLDFLLCDEPMTRMRKHNYHCTNVRGVILM